MHVRNTKCVLLYIHIYVTIMIQEKEAMDLRGSRGRQEELDREEEKGDDINIVLIYGIL